MHASDRAYFLPVPRLRITLAIAILIVSVRAQAAPIAPPPDVTRGERYDGRTRAPTSRLYEWLWVPRAILFVPRLIFDGLLWPVGAGARFVERHNLQTWVKDALTSQDGTIGVRPVLEFATGYRPAFGLTFFDEKLLGPATDFRLTLAGDFSEVITARMQLQPTHEHRAVEYLFDARFSRRADFLFTGIGMAAARSHPDSRYGADLLDLTNQVDLLAAAHVRFGLDGDFGLRRFRDGLPNGSDPSITEVYCVRLLASRCELGTVDETQVPGFNQGTQFLQGGVQLTVDTRNRRFTPASGAYLDLGADYAHELDGGAGWFHTRGTLVGALDLWQESRVLLFRITTEAVWPVGSAPVPFTELPVLGGPDALRGVRLGRFRDQSLVLATAEYRWPIWMWMDASLFVDYGGVFGHAYQGFDLRQMVPGVGGALRLRTTQHFYIRAQLAYGIGDEGWQASISATTDPL
jgi:hypothetical protein